MCRQHVVRSERVGQHAHPDIALVQRLDGCLRAGGQNEIGRLDEQLLLQLGDSPADECDHSSLSLPLAMVSGSSAMTRPCAHTRLSTKLGALVRELLQVLVNRI